LKKSPLLLARGFFMFQRFANRSVETLVCFFMDEFFQENLSKLKSKMAMLKNTAILGTLLI